MRVQHIKSTASFTLVELLIVIGVLAVLTAAVVVIMNPAERLRESRDSRRMQELSSLEKTINVLITQNTNLSIGTSSVVYVSIPDDASSTCGSLGLPALSPGYTYNCVTTANLRKTNSTGWIPIDFSSTGIAMLPTLPIDPVNTTSTGLYYTYMMGGSFEVNAKFESQKYDDLMANDGGDSLVAYERGTNKTIVPAVSSSSSIAHVSSSNSSYAITGEPPYSFSWSHTIASGSNRILVVSIGMLGGAVNNITYNGDAMTQVMTCGFDTPSVPFYTYILVNPDEGTHNVEINVTGMPDEGFLYGFANNYTGVDQSNPIAYTINDFYGEADVIEHTLHPGVANSRGYSVTVSTRGYMLADIADFQQYGDINTYIFLSIGDKILPGAVDQLMEWTNGDYNVEPVGSGAIALRPAS